MKYKLESVEPSNDGKTKFVATFSNDENNKIKKVKFGIEGSFSYVDGASDKIREAYLARHLTDITGNKDPTSKGNLSYYITWVPFQKLSRNIELYKKRFNV
jgi:hypothetical protein